MVTAIGYIPISPDLEIARELFSRLTEEQKSRLSRLGETAIALLSPLTQVRSRQELDSLVGSVMPQFAKIKATTLETLVPTRTELNHFKEVLLEISDHIRQVAQTKADLFGGEAAEQFRGALESSQALSDWMTGKIHQGEDAFYRVLPITQLIARDALAADIAITAILIVLFDVSTDWTPQSILILCQAADDYMANVEDVFLDQAEPDEMLSETVPFDTVRERLGL